MADVGLRIDPLPASWEEGPEPGWFRATSVPTKRAVWSRVPALAHGSVPAEVPRDTATPFRQEVRVVHRVRVARPGSRRYRPA
jgi:hypothetical protein